LAALTEGPGGLAAAERRDHPLWADLARQHYRDRRLRAKIFGGETMFGEPAWDILLDLFIATKERRKVSVMSACIGSAVPSTTALRWISALEREDLISREDDPDDARRTYVALTERGYDAMSEYFEVASRSIKGAALIRARQAEQMMHGELPGPAGPPGDRLLGLPASRSDGGPDFPHKLRA
jgi:hypothetical protein